MCRVHVFFQRILSVFGHTFDKPHFTRQGSGRLHRLLVRICIWLQGLSARRVSVGWRCSYLPMCGDPTLERADHPRGHLKAKR